MITGGNGFIARNLNEYLHTNHIIFVPSSNELNICQYEDVEKFINEHKIDIVIHTAFYNKKRRDICQDKEVETNLKMFLNLHKISYKLEKILYFGSGAEFDKQYDISHIKEDNFGRSIPETAYGFSKYVTNIITRSTTNIYNLRLFGIYGKYEDWRIYFISNLCCKAIYDLPLTIRQDCYFDYLYIDDLMRIVEWFIENTPRYNDYNICSGRRILLSEIANIVKEVSTKRNLTISIAKEGLNLEYTGNNERIKNEIANLYVEPIETSIRKLFNWYCGNIESIDYNILKDLK